MLASAQERVRVGWAAMTASHAPLWVAQEKGFLAKLGLSVEPIFFGAGPPAMQENPSLDVILERLRAAVAKAPEGQWVIGEISDLLIHGDRDAVVPVEQSQLMYDRLIQENVPAQLVTVQNARHSFTAPEGTTPTIPEVNQIILDFLAQYLR